MPHAPHSHAPTLGLVLAAAVTLLLAAAPAAAVEPIGDSAWLHVAVDEAGADGATVRVHLPLALVEAALGLLPDGEANRARLAFDDTHLSLAELEAAWRRTGRRSATLISVDEPHRTTVVSRRGGDLVIDSRGRRRGDDRVELRIAAPVVDALFAGDGDELDLAGAVRAMAAAGAGAVTARSDAGDRVRIWVDRSPDPAARPRSRR